MASGNSLVEAELIAGKCRAASVLELLRSEAGHLEAILTHTGVGGQVEGGGSSKKKHDGGIDKTH